MPSINHAIDFSTTVMNPISGNKGLPIAFGAVSDLLYTDVITFTRVTSQFANEVEILPDPNNTYVNIGTALGQSSQFQSRGYTYTITGVGSSYGYDNTLEIEYSSGGSGDPTFSIDFKGPFLFRVITPHTEDDNFKCILATISNPEVGDYIIIGPPPSNLSVEIVNTWSVGGQEHVLTKHKIYPRYYIDKDTNSWSYSLGMDLAKVIEPFLGITTPKFNLRNESGWELKMFLETEAYKNINTYFSISSSDSLPRTQAYIGSLSSSSYSTGEYGVYLGHSRHHDGSLVTVENYQKANSSNLFIYPLKTDYKDLESFETDHCYGGTIPFYFYRPATVTFSEEIVVRYSVYNSANTLIYSDVDTADLDSQDEGIYYWDLGYFVDKVKDEYPLASRVSVQVADSTDQLFSTYPFDVNYIENNCLDCSSGVQFVYLSSMGVYETIRLYQGTTVGFEGKAVDITHEKIAFTDSSLYDTSEYTHRNRGIVSEETENFYTKAYRPNDYDDTLLMDFLASSDVYKVEQYGLLRSCIVSPDNYVVNEDIPGQILEISVTLAGKVTYTNNLK